MSRRTWLGHAALVGGGYALLFSWLFGASLFDRAYLAQSDLYEYFLPLALAPLTLWSRYEFGGIPTFADGADPSFYPLHVLFTRVIPVWEALPVSAYVLAASLTYAYVFNLTRRPAAAAFAGLAFGLSESMLGRLPHLGALHAFAWFPFVLLAIDRLAESPSRRWVGLGSLGTACFFLAGHPQPVVYGLYIAGAYALVGGWRTSAGTRYYVAVAGMIALAALLAAVKAIPVAEASLHLARQSVSFSQFASHAPALGQLLATLFPAVRHDVLEAPLYTGIVTLAVATLAVARRNAPWRAWFWVVVVALTVAIALGGATPLAQLAYHLPLYDKFRVATRHLFLASFGVAVLGGMAVAALEEGDYRLRPVLVRGGAFLLIVALAAGAALRAPAWALQMPDVTVQIALAGAALLMAAALTRTRRHTVAATALCALLALDLLHASSWPLTIRGADAPTIPAQSALEASVHATRLAQSLAVRGQRLLALGGTHLDPVVPASFARVWRIPIAGGYGPMLLERHRSLALMSTNGEADPAVLAPDNTALDLLAVRYVLVNRAQYLPPQPVIAAGVPWNPARLEWTIGRADCGYQYPRHSSLELPPHDPIAQITIVASMRCGEHVSQGTPVGTLRVTDDAGAVQTKTLRAGEEIADLSLGDPAVRARARHAPVERVDDGMGYVVRWPLDRPARLARLEVDATGFGGWLTIDRLTLLDEQGRARPLVAPWIYLDDASRWREVERFRTSRTSDRGIDQDVGGETEVTVYENTRALPRAWIVPEVVEASQADMLAAVHQGQLPDGRRFDPSYIAMVDAGAGAPPPFPARVSPAIVSDVANGRIKVEVSTEGGGFLVLSEAFFPGWRARIGEQSIRVHRANVSLQGVFLPPGRHTVAFEFAPASFLIGGILTAAAFVLALALVRGTGDNMTSPSPNPTTIDEAEDHC